MEKNHLQAHFALLGVALIYGANYSIAKVVLDGHYIGSNGFILMRVLTATALFWLFFRNDGPQKPSGSDLLRLILCGFLGVSLNQLLFFGGLERTSPIHASLIMVLTPMLVLVLSILLERRRISSIVTSGMTIAGIGTIWLVIPEKGEGIGQGDWVGDIMVAGNATSYALYLILVQSLMKRYPPFWVLKWIFLFGTLFVAFVGWDEVANARWEDFTLPVTLSFGFVLVFTTFFAYLLNAVALRHVAAVTVSVYIYLQPVIATIIAHIMEKDKLTISTLSAGILIITGVWLSVHKPKMISAD